MVTKDEYERYETVRHHGSTNMLDTKAVCRMTRLTKEKCSEIRENYSELMEKYPDVTEKLDEEWRQNTK